jgi:DNA-binding FadR family transcriptional regulator
VKAKLAGARMRDGRKRARPARLASVVVEDLAELIIDGTFAEGDVLPTEPELCEEFGFSRTVVREGLKLLEERGLVKVEQGRGTRVQPREGWNLLDPTVLRLALAHDEDLELLDDLMAVRRVLEREMTRSAASRLTDEDFAQLERALEEMEASYDDYDRFRKLDVAFHAIILRESGNEVGLTIIRVIHAHGGVTRPLSSPPAREGLDRTMREHRAIYDALLARDGDLAGDVLAAHIESGWAERKYDGAVALDSVALDRS